EALQLVLVKVHAQHAVDAGPRDHVRHQLGADRHARLIFAILARVAVIGHHAGDARRRGAPRRVDQEQQLHDVLSRRVRRLENEHVVAAHVLVDPHRDLAVGEAAEVHTTEVDAQVAGDLFGERPVRGSGQELEAVTWYGESVHDAERESWRTGSETGKRGAAASSKIAWATVRAVTKFRRP